jgi:hypothetical protein
MAETWIGLAIGISTLAVALPMALALSWREKYRARMFRSLRQEVSPGVESTDRHR